VVPSLEIKEQSSLKNVLNTALITVNLAAFSFATQPPEGTQDSAQPRISSGEPLPDLPLVDLFSDSLDVPNSTTEQASQSPFDDLFGPIEETPQAQIPNSVDSLFSEDVSSSKEPIDSPLDIPSMFKPFDRKHFGQEVWRAHEMTRSGGDMFHYRFHLKPQEGAPSLSFCGVPVVAGWAHHDRDINEIERHLVRQGFTVIDKPLEEVIPSKKPEEGMLAELKLPSWVTTWGIPVATIVLLITTHLCLGRIRTFVKNRKGTDPDLKNTGLSERGDTQELQVTTSVGPNQPTVRSIDSFEILGDLQKALSINLKPGQRVIAEAGAMMHYQPEIEMRSVTGRSVGFAPVQMGLLGRFLIGESFFFQKFKNNSEETANVTLTPGTVGDFLHLDLAEFPDGICADNGAFFAASSSVQLSIVKRAGLRGALTGIGIFQQRLSGIGDVFLFSPGKLHPFELAEGQRLVVDTHCLFAWQPSVEVKLQSLGIIEGITSGEGLFVCELSGPGKVWISTSGSVARSNGTGGFFSGFGRILDRVF
jgi:uncharacterized protein (TIGR00266 family)